MQRHTQVYMDYFGYQIPEDVFCEIPGCNSPCVDVHHVIPRSKFGKKTKNERDKITNLIGLCRRHHEDAHSNKITVEDINKIINARSRN